jgi:hypothetical protein
MKIFVYVMTHLGDPDEHGCWGCHDCMGEKRAWDYEAVIGVGGVEAKAHGFGGKLKWIGIGPYKRPVGKRGPEVTFDHFCDDFGTGRRELLEMAPKIAEKIRKAPRGFMNLTRDEQGDAEKLLKLAKKAPPSAARAKHGAADEQTGAKGSCLRSAKDQRRPRKRCPRRRVTTDRASSGS